jgi:hypothetical protein
MLASTGLIVAHAVLGHDNERIATNHHNACNCVSDGRRVLDESVVTAERHGGH